ncbi:hypothetical protein FSP39_022166 [Pinctada imbricata]|uniref:Rap-GAP domain-containing protein n=1 Tax=Pinctada imbricata TaxID=66713 RepID=A0AA88XU12_PINIB|nr:hypothetical protein FSP39_022166 [Pinctada imbricata]
MSKEEGNFKSKLRGFFGLKEKPAQITYQRQQTKEITFTPEVLKDISAESPANNRIRTIKELSEVVLSKKLEENAIEALWSSIRDLIEENSSPDNRQVALHFLECLLQGQLSYLGIKRAHFFHVIERLTKPTDQQHRLNLFKILSTDGKNLEEFEEEAGPFLLQWMPSMMVDDKQRDFFIVLINVIKFNAAYLDEEIVTGIVKNTCIISSRNRSEDEIKLCLDLLDAVVCYSYLPTGCLQNFVAALCRMINYPKYSNASWELMRKLLGTHLGHSSIYTMCCILQDRCQQIDQNLLRGAVFFIGMALWGSKKVTTLKHTYSSVLPSILQVLSTNSFVVAYEVVLSVQRLVKKYGKDLQHVEWTIILEILETLFKMLETGVSNTPPDPRMQVEIHDILTEIENLHAHGQFTGCVSRFFKIIEICANKRPENSVSMLIEYHAQLIHPGKENWMSNLYQLLDKYFRHESRTQIRVKALDKLSLVLRVNKHMHEDDLINHVVLPHLSHIETDHDPVVRKVAAEMLLTLAHNCSDQCFMDIIGLLEKIINKPMIARLTSPYPAVEGSEVMQQLDENHLIDIKIALCGLVELFREKLFLCPSSHCLKLYDILVTHMKTQYSDPRQYYSHSAAYIRKQILSMLLDLRSDRLQRMGLIQKSHDNQFSSYITCVPSDVDESKQDITSPLMTDGAAFQWSQSTQLSYTPSFRLFTSCLENDKDWQVLECVLVNLPLLLQNKTLILSTRRELIDNLCHQLCAMVNDRQLGFPEKLTSVPPGRFTRSDFHTFVFPVLSSMVTYHKYLDRAKQRELIKCLEFGLVSKCAKICTNSLRICTLEMQEVMMRSLPSVLLQLSKISATVYMAIPVLAFLSSIVRLPKMYANFVEDEYMSVFAIALPYTNPFKFSHYTVSLAYHVITIWFIRCRMPFRKSFVKFIQKGMRANVIQQFEENSMLQSQNQDSSDRARSGSYNEGALRSRRRMLSGVTRVHQDFHPPVDNKDFQFHMELTETCSDVMARYAFGNFNAIPNRSPVAKFLLEGGQSQTWLLGNKIVTITTSGGGGNKGTQGGLCEKCIAYYQGSSEQNEQAKQTPVSNSGRRRHRSEIVFPSRSSTSADLGLKPGMEESSGPRTSLDDLSIRKESSSEQDIGVQTGSSLTDHTPKMGLETEALESYLYGLKQQSSDGRMFQNHMCNCWCTGWAEVYIRAPSGNTSWMMRIENEAALTSLMDSQVPDITLLFTSVQKKQHPDLDSLSSRIDSGSIGEEEYESLYDQHFPSDHSQDGRGLADDNDVDVLIDEDLDNEEGSPQKQRKEIHKVNFLDNFKWKIKEKNGLEIPRPVSSELDEHGPTLKRYNSSPSVIGSSCDDLDEHDIDVRDALSESIVVEVNKHEYIEEDRKSGISSVASDKIDGTSQSHEEQNKTKNIEIKPNLQSVQNHLLQNMSPSPANSEASSAYDEVSELPSIRKVRGHTVSVAQPSKDSRLREEVSGLKSKVVGVKDAGRGGVNPSFVFLQLYNGGLLSNGSDAPLLLPQSEAITRSLSVLDRIHPFETHKIGVVYVGPRQTKDEKAILSNRYGSERFAKFMGGLGSLIRLTRCDPSKVYVGGLDTTSGRDGEFAIGWQDESMHVIFHVATLMPNRDSDPNCNAKKLHIGNDYVTIVYNDSGEDYRIGVIKGQFNYVNIVIKPLDFVTNTVTLQAKEDIADILGHKDTKVISDDSLAALVRQIAVNCDLASLVLQRQQTQPQDPYASNWLERLRKIRNIRTKVNSEIGPDQGSTEMSRSPSHTPNHTKLLDFTHLV